MALTQTECRAVSFATKMAGTFRTTQRRIARRAVRHWNSCARFVVPGNGASDSKTEKPRHCDDGLDASARAKASCNLKSFAVEAVKNSTKGGKYVGGKIAE